MLRVLIFTVLLTSAFSALAAKETCGTIVGCIECPDPAVCIVCDGSLNFDRKPNDKGTCSCLTGFYLNRYKCLACDTSKPYCLTCSDDGNICTSCLAGYFVDKGSCSACGSFCETCKSSAACDKCQSGYFWSGKVCESCGITSCETCSKAKVCTKCEKGYYLKHHVNPLSSNYTCEKCLANCDQCTTNTTCDVCTNGYYKDASQKCVQCSSLFPNCLKCSDKKCEQCKDATLYVADSGKCESCHTTENHCATCRSPTDCITCESDKYFVSHTCVECNLFNPGCLTCQTSPVTSTTFCTSCSESYYLDQKLCVSCSKEDQYCLTCTGKQTCTKCIGDN